MKPVRLERLTGRSSCPLARLCSLSPPRLALTVLSFLCPNLLILCFPLLTFFCFLSYHHFNLQDVTLGSAAPPLLQPGNDSSLIGQV